jgi:site-specific DNA-methyltransferase (adenine-specific)
MVFRERMAAKLYNSDCLDIFERLEPGSVDFVLVDPPYGKTKCKWDSVIAFERMWAGIDRAAKKDAVVAIFSAQPFSSALISSNYKNFRQELIWDKAKGSNPLLAKKRIMGSHENIELFCRGKMFYEPQMRKGAPYKAPRTGGNRTNSIVGSSDKEGFRQKDNSGFRYPLSVLQYSIHCGSKLHPSQKPVELLKYLIRTYSRPGEVVLDFCMGSGSTGVAALQEGRDFVGVELDKAYFTLSEKRIRETMKEK